MRAPRWLLTHLAVDLTLILGLALASGYRLPDFKATNWQIVLFLTPWGLIQNHLDEHSVIRTFYSDVSPGQTTIGPGAWAVMALVYVGLVVNMIWCVKRRASR